MSHAVLTGPIHTKLTLADGTEVDVRSDVAYVETAEQAAELADLIGRHYADNGHPLHDPVNPFVFTPQEG